MKKNNVYTQVHYIPCHLMPYYSRLGYKKGDFINAELYYNGCLSIPMYPSLTDSQLEYITNLIIEFYKEQV